MNYTITITKTIKMENNWTNRVSIVLKDEGIPPRAEIKCHYNELRNETVICATYKEIRNL